MNIKNGDFIEGMEFYCRASEHSLEMYKFLKNIHELIESESSTEIDKGSKMANRLKELIEKIEG